MKEQLPGINMGFYLEKIDKLFNHNLLWASHGIIILWSTGGQHGLEIKPDSMHVLDSN